MKTRWYALMCVALPIVSSAITYAFISLGNDALELDDTQALIVMTAIAKMLLLGSSGVFPISLNGLVDKLIGRDKRDEVNTLYKVPPVTQFPCIRRLLCEAEAAARSSDTYNNLSPKDDTDRILEEERSPETEDPFTEAHIEAVKALYREEDPTELTADTRRALGLMEGLTGRNCEEAYRRCVGRMTPGMYFKIIFDELNYIVEDEQDYTRTNLFL